MKLPKTAVRSVEAIVGLLDVGKPTVVRTEEIADAGEVSSTDVNRTRRLLQFLGVLEWSIDRNIRTKQVVVTYTLLKPADEVWKAISDYDADPSFAVWRATHGGEGGLLKNWEDKRKVKSIPEPIVIAPPRIVDHKVEPPESLFVEENPFAVVAPLRKSEPRALVEAARQYQHKREVGRRHAEELRSEGLISDVDIFMRGLELHPDPELEMVSKVIPLIEEFERTIKNMERFQSSTKEKASKVETLERENAALRKQNERLIARLAEPTNA